MYEVGTAGSVYIEALIAGIDELDLEAVRREVRLQSAHDAGFVFDHEDPRAPPTGVRLDGARHAVSFFSARVSVSGRSTGTVKTKRAPPPSRFSTRMRPPCATTRPLATASPSP